MIIYLSLKRPSENTCLFHLVFDKTGIGVCLLNVGFLLLMESQSRIPALLAWWRGGLPSVLLQWTAGSEDTQAQLFIPNLLSVDQVTLLWQWVREMWEARDIFMELSPLGRKPQESGGKGFLPQTLTTTVTALCHSAVLYPQPLSFSLHYRICMRPWMLFSVILGPEMNILRLNCAVTMSPVVIVWITLPLPIFSIRSTHAICLFASKIIGSLIFLQIKLWGISVLLWRVIGKYTVV